MPISLSTVPSLAKDSEKEDSKYTIRGRNPSRKTSAWLSADQMLLRPATSEHMVASIRVF